MSNSANLYTVTPRKARGMILDCFAAGLVPFLKGPPGVGKSAIIKSIAEEHNLKMIDHRLSTSEPTDLLGLPKVMDDHARFVPFKDLFPLRGMPLPPNKDGWMLFLDEFNSALKPTQAASYKLILDRMTGQEHLHERVVLCAAGNRESDRAIVNAISTAMQSRVVTMELEVSHQDWLEDVALKEGYDSRIIAYLSQHPSKLMDFRPDHVEHTFCCPRTWEFMNRLIQGKEVDPEKTTLYAGTITSGIAVDFVQFTKVYKNLVNFREVLEDPENCRIPGDLSTKWATITHLMEKVEDKNFGALATYASRFPLDFRILFFRSTLVQKPALRSHPAFKKAMGELNRYLTN